MKKEKFKQYAEIKNKIKALTTEAKDIEKEVLSEMQEIEAKTVKSDFGTFSIVERKSWTYTDEVKELEMQNKVTITAIKKLEEEEGKATLKVSESLMFRGK